MMSERCVDATEQLVVELLVADLARSKAFYESLGFELLYESSGFASLTWEGHRFFLDERPGSSPVPVGRMNVRIMVPDVDAAWRRVNELGCRVLSVIYDRSYALRDFTIADPDGFGVRFASKL